MGDLRVRAVTAAAAMTALCLAVPAAVVTLSAAAATAGRVYAAIGYSNGNATLLVGHLGERPHKILQGTNPGAIVLPAVAPGGHRIAYVDETDYVRLAVINVDGTHRRFLTGKVEDRDMSQPVWSPDGRTIYVGMRRFESPGYHAYTVRADGVGRAVAITNGSNAAPETVRRDGRLIAFNTMRSGDRWMSTGVMSVSGSGRHLAGPTNLWNASWQPGSNVVAVARVLRDDGGVTIQIQLLNTRTGRYHALPVTQSVSTYGAAYPLAWSNSGAHLFYLHYDYRDGNQVHPRVYRIRSDGTGRTDVTPDIPTWANGQIALQGR